MKEPNEPAIPHRAKRLEHGEKKWHGEKSTETDQASYREIERIPGINCALRYAALKQ
jgi:hypothetical protein